MRELHGVIDRSVGDFRQRIKRISFLFDTLHVIDGNPYMWRRKYVTPSDQEEADDQFLTSKGFLKSVRDLKISGVETDIDMVMHRSRSRVIPITADEGADYFYFVEDPASTSDSIVRVSARHLRQEQEEDPLAPDIAPLCFYPIERHSFGSAPRSQTDVLHVASTLLPSPGQDCSWEDILAFKDECRDKQWAFRRFLQDLSAKNRSQAEVVDDVEWCLNEYRKAMQIVELKSSQGLIDVFLITPLEIIENLLKLNWSAIAKGAFQMRKRRIDMLEMELKAPGRECAYLFKAGERFGDPTQRRT